MSPIAAKYLNSTEAAAWVVGKEQQNIIYTLEIYTLED